MRRIIAVSAAALLMVGGFAGCSGQGSSKTPKADSGFDSSRSITVVSREDGSGTRGAFIELFGVEEKGADGSRSDKTTKEAVIAPKTNVMLSSVAGDPHSIGYVSLGSLNPTVKALEIDGVAATVENIKNGSYKISRPFLIATKGEAEGVAKDFIGFIHSAEGQKVVANGYIPVEDNAPAYRGERPSGKIVVAGSSSVTPIMEKLKEAYTAVNPDAQIEIQQSDSSTGMQGAMDGSCDIGMASRELKDSERSELTAQAIALDGIAVIVNPGNTLDGLTSAGVKAIFTGETTRWNAAS